MIMLPQDRGRLFAGKEKKATAEIIKMYKLAQKKK